MIVGLARDLAKIKASTIRNKDAASRRAIFYALKKQGGVYIKSLQVLAVTQKFLEGWAGPSEMRVFDQIEPENVTLDNYVNRDEFKWISVAPVATGSFAVVYQGELLNDEWVAIKILRPSIEKNLRKDLRQLKLAAKLFKRFLMKTVVDYEAVMTEFADTCLAETDYAREVDNMRYFQKFYAGHPYVKIPQVYDGMCRHNVIVQEWIEGETFASILAAREKGQLAAQLAHEKTGSNLWTQLIVAGGEALRMAICADFVFGDPHPGNIKLLADNQIAFIDFGIVANRPTSRAAFHQWVLDYRNVLDGGGSKEIVQLAETTMLCFCPDVAFALRGCEVEGVSAMQRIMTGVREKLALLMTNDAMAQDLVANGHLFRMFTDVLDKNNALGLRLDMTNFQLLKAMQSYLGSLTVLDEGDTGDKFATAMLAAMNYALESVAQHKIENDMPMTPFYSQGESMTVLLDTLSSLASGDEFLFRYLSGNIEL